MEELQWGHVQMNVEIVGDGDLRDALDTASMGPRSNERGNILAKNEKKDFSFASMGPRSNERGNTFEKVQKTKYNRSFNGATFK